MIATADIRASKGYHEQLQSLADKYFEETRQDTATTKEIALWAIASGHWDAPPDLVLRKCREDFAKAMREQYVKNDAGQPVRAKHVARIVKGDTQQHLWADIRTAPRAFMQRAFTQRREQIVGDCRQLKRDVDYYNGHHPSEKEIQMMFDFRDDVAEGEFSGQYNPRRPR